MSQAGISQSVRNEDSLSADTQSDPSHGESPNNECDGRSHADKDAPLDSHGIENVKQSEKSKKRKRNNKKEGRNVKTKSNDSTVLNKESSLSQILGPSLDELLATNTPLPASDVSADDDSASLSVPLAVSSPTAASVPSDGKRSRAGRKPTRLTAVKELLKAQTEENDRLMNSIKLLEKEIDKKNKEIDKKTELDSKQKLEIKKLLQANESLRRELSNCKEIRKSAPEPVKTSTDIFHQSDDSNISCVNDGLSVLKKHVTQVAKSLLAAVGENNDESGFITVSNRRHKTNIPSPPVNDMINSTAASNSSATNEVTSSLSGRKSPPDVTSDRSRSPVTASAPSFAATAASTKPATRASAPAPMQGNEKPKIAIVGTSLVRGLGHKLNKRGFDVSSFMYPGAEILAIRERVHAIFPPCFSTRRRCTPVCREWHR